MATQHHVAGKAEESETFGVTELLDRSLREIIKAKFDSGFD